MQDQEIEFVITEFNPRRRRIIGDRKQLLVAEKAEQQKELFERIHAGDVVEGTSKECDRFRCIYRPGRSRWTASYL